MELQRRKLGASKLESYKAEQLEWQKAHLRSVRPSTYHGTGRDFLGHFNSNFDQLSGMQEYETTLWVVVVYFPLIPLATYRVRRRPKESWLRRVFSPSPVTVIDQLPRDWPQIFLTWAQALLVVVLVCGGTVLLGNILDHRR
jgi:hypothetical protein